MDFAWTTEQDELYAGILLQARENFGNRPVRPYEQWTRAEWHRCAQMGLLGLSVPPQYGGCGYDALTTARAIEAFGRGCEDMGLIFSATAQLFACTMPIVEYGSVELKQTLLPTLCSGESIAGNAITEEEAGSDVFALKTRAVRDGDSYVLTGAKSYVSNGPIADFFVVYASTNPAHGYLGITSFVLARDTPGLVMGEPFQKYALSSTPACQIALRECRVPATNIIGREGQGATVFKQSMQWERACLFSAYLGQMERQLEETITFARKRRQFGKAIGNNQAVAHRLVNRQLGFESARLLLYRACWQLALGQDSTLAISLAKLAVSEAALQMGLDALHIQGSVGFQHDSRLEQTLMNTIPGTIFSGTSEIQRNIIASELGL